MVTRKRERKEPVWRRRAMEWRARGWLLRPRPVRMDALHAWGLPGLRRRDTGMRGKSWWELSLAIDKQQKYSVSSDFLSWKGSAPLC